MYTLIFQPPALPPGEYKYACKDDEHAQLVLSALKTLGVELIDIERDGESLTVQEYAELTAG